MKGVDLVAIGEQPVNWRLEMDFDKEFRLMNSRGDSLVVSAVKPVYHEDAKVYIYKANMTQGIIEIHLYKELCKNRGKELFRAEVKTPDQLYLGCYQYQENKGLHGTWELEMIDDKPVTEYAPASTPAINIDLSLNKMTGFDGCNTISASLQIQGDRILFAPLMSTKKFCENNQTGEIFIRWISDRLVNYTLTDEILTLNLGNDSRLTFRRKH